MKALVARLKAKRAWLASWARAVLVSGLLLEMKINRMLPSERTCSMHEMPSEMGARCVLDRLDV